MSGFIGNYADLTNYRLGEFTVEGLAGRNPGGEPRWNVVCQRCNGLQILPHCKIVRLIEGRRTQLNLQCGNGACPASRTTSTIESGDEYRRRVRREEAAAASQAAEARHLADAAAVKQRAADAQRLALQREYIRYWIHQTKAGTDDADIVSRARWEQLTPGTREQVLDIITKDPTVRISGL